MWPQLEMRMGHSIRQKYGLKMALKFQRLLSGIALSWHRRRIAMNLT